MSWYGNTTLKLRFPEDWNVKSYKMNDKPNISESEIDKSFLNPIGTPRISELANRKRNTIIAVDDLTRPTQAYRFMPIILEELKRGGMDDSKIQIIMATGAHRTMGRRDLIKKLGSEIVDKFAIHNHNPYENLISLGETSRGTPLKVNKLFMNSDLKIGVGSVIPHPTAGFSGGGKIVLPGLCGIETLEYSHAPVLMRRAGGIGTECNEFRTEIEEGAQKAKVDIIINTVVNSLAQTAQVFVGDPIKAYRVAVNHARQIYATKLPKNLDIAVFNAFPKDTEFTQCCTALNVWSAYDKPLVKKGGAIVIISASPEGRGLHFLTDRGMRLYRHFRVYAEFRHITRNRRFIFFCPNVSRASFYDYFPKKALLLKRWEDVIEKLVTYYGSNANVGIFPCGSLQLDNRLMTNNR